MRKINIGNRKLKNLPFFFNYLISNRQIETKEHYHFNDCLKVYQDYIRPEVPISKI